MRRTPGWHLDPMLHDDSAHAWPPSEALGERQMRIYQHTSTTRERVCPKRTCLRRVLVFSEPPLALRLSGVWRLD